MNQLEKDTEIQGNQNNLLEEKIKTEIDNTLGNAEEAEGVEAVLGHDLIDPHLRPGDAEEAEDKGGCAEQALCRVTDNVH